MRASETEVPALRCELAGKHGHWSDPIGDLEKPLWIAIVDGCSRHFAIEYRLIVQINTRWGVAPSDHATPRELLMSFGLNPAEYSLYAIDGKDPLPPDTPLNLRRGERFEAQKDGRYGAPATTANGHLRIEEELETLRAAGFDARLHSKQGQLYVEIGRLTVPSPPWSAPNARILSAVPATYPASASGNFTMKLRMKESDYVTLARVTVPSFRRDVEFPPETGCILLLGKNDHPLNPAFTVATLFEPSQGDLEERGLDGLVFSSHYLRRALLEVRRRRLAGFLTVHTHPLAEDKVYFSQYDDANDPSLMENLYELHCGGVFGSVVLGRSSAAARIWSTQTSRFLPLTELVVVGEQLRFIPLDGTVGKPATPAAIFDRAMAVTGRGELATLSRMRVGIIGAGGTGSLMIELAARAGVGEISEDLP